MILGATSSSVTSPMSLGTSLEIASREHFIDCYLYDARVVLCPYPCIVAFLLEIKLLPLLMNTRIATKFEVIVVSCRGVLIFTGHWQGRNN